MGTSETIHKHRVNFALILFVIITGLILLGNLFEVVTWEIWPQGLIFIGGVFFVNILYTFLRKKKCSYKALQIITILLSLGLLTHTFLAITNPNYLKKEQNGLTQYEFFQKTSELKTQKDDDIKKKVLNIVIEQSQYLLTDSNNSSYYFKTHPPVPPNTNSFIGYQTTDSNLEVQFQSLPHELSWLQKFLRQRSTLVLGHPNIPTDINLNVELAGDLVVDFKGQKINDFVASLNGGETILKFSKNSIPKEKFLITLRGGTGELKLPKDLNHNIEYNVRNKGKLFLPNRQVEGKDIYKIISKEENKHVDVRILIDSGELKISTH